MVKNTAKTTQKFEVGEINKAMTYKIKLGWLHDMYSPMCTSTEAADFSVVGSLTSRTFILLSSSYPR